MAQLVKNPPAMQETLVRSLGWDDPLEKGQLLSPILWPGEFHGLYSPRGRKESDTTEPLSLSIESTMKNIIKPTLLISVAMLKSYKLEKIFERAFTHLTICVNTLTIYVLMTA